VIKERRKTKVSIKGKGETDRVKLKNSLDAARYVAVIADGRKADYIKVLNVSKRLVITDYFILISARNNRLTRRISEDIFSNLKKSDLLPLNIDGLKEGNWILMDYDDFVVHIFTDEYREYYDLERLWRDSKVLNKDGLEK
jgi:ribosome-associated protein